MSITDSKPKEDVIDALHNVAIVISKMSVFG